MQIQANLGADLIVAFDDHESARFDHDQTLKSLELTERWGLRSAASKTPSRWIS